MIKPVLHIITPHSTLTPPSMIEAKRVNDQDFIADFRRFPFTLHQVCSKHGSKNVTANLLTTPDYWAVVRNWLIDFTDVTNLQDILAIDGHTLWWSLIYAQMEPGLAEFGSAFAWIDLLKAVNEKTPVKAVTLHGAHAGIAHLVRQVLKDATIEVEDEPKDPVVDSKLPLSKFALLTARMVMSVVFFFYTMIRRSEICIYSSANLLRKKAVWRKQKLSDVYMGDLAQTLRKKEYRVSFFEQYAINASWQGFWTRRFFFPTDLLLGLSHPRLNWLIGHSGITKKWQRKWTLTRSALIPHSRYNGYDISPFVVSIVREAFSGAAHQESGYKLWRLLLKFWRPKLIYIGCSYCKFVVPLTIAARSLKIVTVEQQHGIIAKNHLSYIVPQHLRMKSQLPLCDYLMAWGDFVKRLLLKANVYRPDQIKVVGFGRLDSLLEASVSQKEVFKILNIPSDVQIALYTSNSIIGDVYEIVLDSIKNVEGSSVYWLIKLHPRERTRSLWENAVEERQLQQIRIIEDAVDFYTLLDISDLHITFCSTTMVEAAVFKKPNLGLELAENLDPVGYEESGAFMPVAPNQLGPTVVSILQDNTKLSRLLREQKDFAIDWCYHDGRAIEHVVAFLESKI